MDLSNLKPAKGSVRERKRIGRGQGSGYGGTSTRGHKGAGQRSGNTHKIGFEGGQMPLQRILPKFGFKNPTRVEYKAINLSAIEALGMDEIKIEDMKAAGLADKNEIIKILGKGEISKAVTVEANAFSKSAIEKIEAAGGKAVVNE